MVSFPKADGNSASIFRINTLDSHEYFLIENRQFTGYDAGFQRQTGASGHGGLVIYHVDKLETGLWPNFNTVNADENDKGVDVEEANEGSLGYSMLDTRTYATHTDMFFFLGNNTLFFRNRLHLFFCYFNIEFCLKILRINYKNFLPFAYRFFIIPIPVKSQGFIQQLL